MSNIYSDMENCYNSASKTTTSVQSQTIDGNSFIMNLVEELTKDGKIKDDAFLSEKAIYKLLMLQNMIDLTCFEVLDISNIKSVFSILLTNKTNSKLKLTLITKGIPVTDIECFILQGDVPTPMFNGIHLK